MNSARAAINAALEAARAASSRGHGGAKRPNPPAAEAPAAAPATAPAPTPAPAPASSNGARFAPAAAPAPAASGGAPRAPAAAPNPAPAPSAPPPWEQGQPKAAAGPQAARNQYEADVVAEDEPPSWVTEFSDDSAVAAAAPAALAAPAAARAPARAPHAYVITPVPAIGWDGNWPALAATLPLRGVSQQLALQTELVECAAADGAATFRLRVPIDTLRASGNSEKLCAALQERFPDVHVVVDTEIGPVWYTASAEAKAWREQCQREAEATVAGDPFVQDMMRTFDAFVVPGSVRPAAA
jgi:DNA polymerase-3 subunit gamma/tau